MTFVFDTCAFISWYNEYYPPRVFPDIEKLIIGDIEEGIIIFPKDVEKELKVQEDNLSKLISGYQSYVNKDGSDFEERKANIINACPKLIKSRRQYNADPSVIALAQMLEGTVVTQESTKKDTGIVACCRNKNIRCVYLVEYFIERENDLKIIRKN